MSRYIQIQGTNTTVGYDYLKSSYYVTNTYGTTSYTTYRTSIENTLDILHTLNIASITQAQLQALHDNEEELQDLYFTYSDNGSYIHSIQFNDYKDFPLVIDCEKSKLYILNSDIVYNLTTNESPTAVRIPYICSFYINKLGLYISNTAMNTLYNLLTSFYEPTCYISIVKNTDTNTLYYTNTFNLSNYNNNSKILYTGTYNALGTTSPTSPLNIEAINSTNKTITLITTPTNLQIGNTVSITNSNVVIDNTTYTSDGTYTVSNIDTSNKQITVSESIPVSYNTVYPECYVETATATIHEIERDSNTITLTEQVPDNILVGDTIHVTGTTQTLSSLESVTCDGTYTVSNINNKTITTVEQIPTNFTGNTGSIYKEVYVGDIRRITKDLVSNHSVIYVLNSSNIGDITSSMHLHIYGITGINSNTSYTISNVSATSSILMLSSDIGTTYTQAYPILYKEIPTQEVLVNVTESNLDKFPKGEFMLNNFAEAIQYLYLAGGASGADYPTADMENYFSQAVPLTYPIESVSGISTMNLLGLYSDVYGTDETQ